MLDLTQFLVSSAFAQTPEAAPNNSSSSVIMSFLPLILIFVVFYVLIIRPQNKKIETQEKMIKALKRGDRVITSGGIYGKIVKLEGDDTLVLEIADNVQIKVTRTSVQTLVSKTEPVADDTAKKD